jgi:hypothetical protein
MPILYGEGEQSAFFRLQVLIFQMFPDHSIFVWQTSAIKSVVFSEPELGLVEDISINDSGMIDANECYCMRMQ